MAARLTHRGPDDEGSWTDAEAGVALGFRRLAVLDTSVAGRQPMESSGGRYVIVFNGEIYNHEQLRRELRPGGRGWRGHSDSETLLAGIEQWGVERTLERSVGMFAFAVWDRDARELVLARDRIGEKPCYYGWQGSVFLFGSELKALRAHPHFAAEVDRDVVALFLRYGYVPAPHCIYRGLHKLLPGTLLRIGPESHACGPDDAVPYWTLARVLADGDRRRFDGTEEEAVDELERRLTAAIGLQRLADVPVGAFLSGGVDSSTVVALLQRNSTSPVKTFTIGFDVESSDESGHAAKVARYLGTDHTELQVSADDAMQVVPMLGAMYDEPFADASAIPTFLVSRLAREHVTVSLSGDGGDELFAGYRRYSHVLRLQEASKRLPRAMRRTVAQLLDFLPAGVIGNVLAATAIGRNPHLFASRLDTLRTALWPGSLGEIFRTQVSLWSDPGSVLAFKPSPLADVITEFDEGMTPASRLGQMMYIDSVSFLPDDILVKLDRAAMAVSLESRVPFLDHRIVEFAWSLPPNLKLRDGVTKWVLRRLLARYVPDQLVERPKQGMGSPTGEWMRGSLRLWAEDLLLEPRLRTDGYLRPEVVGRLWAQHLAGRQDWQNRLWPLVILQDWLRVNR